MKTITLRSDAISVEISPHEGGRIASLTTSLVDRDREIILTRAERQALLGPRPRVGVSPIDWGCFPMAPWPGRIRAGQFEFEGVVHHVPADHDGSAIHGTVLDRTWTVIARSATRVVLEAELGPTWPWVGRVVQSIEVRHDTIGHRLEVEAGPGARFPAGAGIHPWFRRRGHDPAVRVDAQTVFLTDGRLIPTGETGEPSGATDLGSGTPLGPRRIDSVFGNVRSPIEIAWPDLTLKLDCGSARFACVYTPAEAFCVEPMSCPADAFNLGDGGGSGGVHVVTPDDPLEIEIDWKFWPAP